MSSTPPLLQQIIIFSLCCNEKVNETMHKNKNNEKLFEHYCLKFLVIFLFKGLGLSQICIYRSVVCICNLHYTGEKTVYAKRSCIYRPQSCYPDTPILQKGVQGNSCLCEILVRSDKITTELLHSAKCNNSIK